MGLDREDGVAGIRRVQARHSGRAAGSAWTSSQTLSAQGTLPFEGHYNLGGAGVNVFWLATIYLAHNGQLGPFGMIEVRRRNHAETEIESRRHQEESVRLA